MSLEKTPGQWNVPTPEPEQVLDFRALAEALPNMVFVADRLGNWIYTNDRLKRFTGKALRDLLGKGWEQSLHPDDRASFQAAWGNALVSGEGFEIEHRLLGADGIPAWFLCRAAPVREDGAIQRWVGTCTEIEDRKHAETLLERSEAWFRSTFRHTAVGIAHIGTDGRFLAVNDRLCFLLGRARAELLDLEYRSISHPADIDAADNGLAAMLRGEANHFTVTKRFLRADRTVLWGHVTISVARDRAGAVQHFVAFLEDITAHKAHQDRLEATLHASGAVGWEWDPVTNTVLHTGDEHGVFGRKLLSADDFFDSIYPEERDLVVQAAYQTLMTGEPYELEFRIVGKDGVERWVRDQGHRIQGDDRPRLAGLLSDITAEKRAREALREREERLRLAFEAARTSAWDWDIGSGEVVWSETLAAYAGLDPDTFGGTFDAFWSLVHEDDKPALKHALAAALAGEAEYAVEFRMVRPDGSIRWTSTRAIVLRDDAGRPLRMVGVDADITDRKLAELALRESERRFRAIIEAMPQIVWSTLPDGYHDFYNSRWYEFTGVEAGLTDGHAWNTIFHPDDQERARQVWQQSLQSGEPYEIEYRLRYHDGSYRWVLGRALPMRRDDGTIVRWMGTCTDIHEMVEIRQALAESQAALEAARSDLERRVWLRTAELATANERLREEVARREATHAALIQSQKLEALGQLVSGVAHDFNNVIQAVAGGYAIIERRSSDPRLTEMARHGARAAERGGRLVRQLLAFARQEELQPQVVRPEKLLEEAEPLLARSAGAGVAIAIDCPAGLPPIWVDPTLLETALINLAVNAGDAMEDGGTLTIAVADCPIGTPHRPPELENRAALAIAVSDTGSGMTPEVLQRVMEPFFTTKGPGKGTGLGLAMVHGFARQSGGALRIESRPGIGTNVTVYLPVAPETGVTADGLESSAGVVAAQKAATILLVDDDDEVRALLAAQLTDLGHVVVEADGSASALAALERREIDLVVSDVLMPGMTGDVLAASLRDRRPGLPILFITGNADTSNLVGEQVLGKPFNTGMLASAVEAILRSHRSALEPDEPYLDHLQKRMKADCLKELLAAWRRMRGSHRVPKFAAFELAQCPEPGKMFIVHVDAAFAPMRFHFALAGAELEAALGRALTGTDLAVTGDDDPGGHEAAFRRCVRSGKPAYDYARMNLGSGVSDTFERLLLPLSTDGTTIDRIVGMAVVSGFGQGFQ